MRRLHEKLNTLTTPIIKTKFKQRKCKRNKDFDIAPNDGK